MSKFGELIEASVPVLLEFFSESDQISQKMNSVLRTVASEMADDAKVIKIDIEKNKELAEALKIKELPTLMVYKEGEMKWRQAGELDSDAIVAIIKEYL